MKRLALVFVLLVAGRVHASPWYDIPSDHATCEVLVSGQVVKTLPGTISFHTEGASDEFAKFYYSFEGTGLMGSPILNLDKSIKTPVVYRQDGWKLSVTFTPKTKMMQVEAVFDYKGDHLRCYKAGHQ
ncbi:MAG: hypothetical protein ACLQDQ_05450 [Myxococcaceae bacterium]